MITDPSDFGENLRQGTAGYRDILDEHCALRFEGRVERTPDRE